MSQTVKNFAITLSLFILVQLCALAQQDQPDSRRHGRRSLTILHIQEAPVLDGFLNEQTWQAAAVTGEFLQRDPDEGMPVSERTEVRALYDQENLYFGIRCFDSQSDGIIATELRRDNGFANDDSFSVVLDTFHDHRNAFLFKINPAGTQYDALITEEGRDVNADWDEKWEVETQVDEEGWTAEIKIPLTSIRFSSQGTDFGIDFERIIRRKNEFGYWNNYLRSFNFRQLSQAGHLLGLSEVESAAQIRVKPYVNLRTVTQGADQRRTIHLGDVGLEDLKVPVTSGLTLDVTANTDFAQTEVDNQIINFDRFPSFFPEKREFFLEGAGIFGVSGLRVARSPDIKLYHSRRIGLSSARLPIPILVGAKLAGKLGDKFTLGILEAQTDDFQGQEGDNFAVFRLKRDILSRSSLGFFASNRQGEGGDFNRVVAVDHNLVFFEHLKVVGLLARSFTDGLDDGQWAGAVESQWTDAFVDASFTYVEVRENFETDLGFLKREAIRRHSSRIMIRPRPNSDLIRQLNFGVHYEQFLDVRDNELVTDVYHLDNGISFQNGSAFNVNPHRRTEVVVGSSLSLPGLDIAPGKYSWWYAEINYRSNPARKLSGSLSYRPEWNYYGQGNMRHQWGINPVVKFSSRFSFRVGYSMNRIEPVGLEAVNFHQMNNTFSVAFSRQWLTSTQLQYNSSNDVLGVNFRLNYIYRPGDDLFFVYTEFRDQTDPITDLDRQIVLKFTHSFDF